MELNCIVVRVNILKEKENKINMKGRRNILEEEIYWKKN